MCANLLFCITLRFTLGTSVPIAESYSRRSHVICSIRHIEPNFLKPSGKSSLLARLSANHEDGHLRAHRAAPVDACPHTPARVCKARARARGHCTAAGRWSELVQQRLECGAKSWHRSPANYRVHHPSRRHGRRNRLWCQRRQLRKGTSISSSPLPSSMFPLPCSLSYPRARPWQRAGNGDGAPT